MLGRAWGVASTCFVACLGSPNMENTCLVAFSGNSPDRAPENLLPGRLSLFVVAQAPGHHAVRPSL